MLGFGDKRKKPRPVMLRRSLWPSAAMSTFGDEAAAIRDCNPEQDLENEWHGRS